MFRRMIYAAFLIRILIKNTDPFDYYFQRSFVLSFLFVSLNFL